MSLLAALLGSRSSLENPSSPLSDPDDWAYESLGAAKTIPGLSVNRVSALTYPPVWRAVDRISSDVAKVPAQVHKRAKSGGKNRDTEHPAYQLLRRRPNAYMTPFVFKKTMQAHVLLEGNAYAYIERRGDGAPMELLPITPDKCYPVRENGRLWYVVETTAGTRKVDPTSILHIKGLGYDGLVGYSVLTKARENLAVGMAAQEYTARFFLNNARASVVLEHPGSLTKEASERLRTQWNELHAGLENSHKTAILEEGMKAHEMTIGAKDAQLIESRKFSIKDVANWFGLPAHKVGDDSKASYNSLEQENQSYLDDCLDSWFVAWEEELEAKLLSDKEQKKDTHTIEFNRGALVRADLTARGNFYQKAVGGPIMTPDEARALENMNALPDNQGAKLLRPQNMTVAGDEPEPEPEPVPAVAPAPAEPKPGEDDEDEGERAARQLLADSVGRMVRRLTTGGRKAAKRPAQFLEWAEGLHAEHGEAVRAAVVPALVVCGVPALRREAAVARIFAGVRDALVGVYDTATPAEFEAKVAETAERLDETLAESITGGV